MNVQTRQGKPPSTYGSERAALVTLYAAKLAAVATLPAYLQRGAREAIRAEEAAALQALKAKARRERAAAKVGRIGGTFRAAARDVTELVKRPARRRSRERQREGRKAGPR